MKKLTILLTILLIASSAWSFEKKSIDTGAYQPIVQPFRQMSMTYGLTHTESIVPLTDTYYIGDMAGNFTMCVDIDSCFGGATCGIEVDQQVSHNNITWYDVNSTDREVFTVHDVTGTYCDQITLTPSLYTRFWVEVTPTTGTSFKNLVIMGN